VIVHQFGNCGWQPRANGNLWYTVGNRVIGTPSGHVEYAAPRMIEDSMAAEFSERGELAAWKAKIATKALFSTSLSIGISAGLAAPLMRASGLNNFTIFLSATTRGGKSTTMLVGMSVGGIGDEMKLMNWNSSGIAELLEASTAFNDTLFSLNEVGSAEGEKKEAYRILRGFYMKYADGRDRRRHSQWEKAHGGRAKTFHGICMVSAEHPISWYAMQAGDARDGGELFRAIDLPVVQEGHVTVLDLAPEGLNHDEFLDQLRDDLKITHGSPIGPYIEHLRKIGAIPLNKRVRKLINAFVKAMPAAAHDKVARQIAKHIGVLYAGGVLGIEAGILPWNMAHVWKTHRAAFEAAYEHCKIVDPLEMGLKLLAANMRDNVVERATASTFGPHDHAGYWEILGGEKYFVVHSHQFRSWFSGDRQFRLVIEGLAAHGYLKQAEDSPEGIITQRDIDGHGPRWPHGKPVRSYIFRDPFPGSREESGEPSTAALEVVPAVGIVRPEDERPERPSARPPHGKRPKNGKHPEIAVRPRANGKALTARPADKARLGGKAVAKIARAAANAATNAAKFGAKTGASKRPTSGESTQNAVKPIVRGQKTTVNASDTTAVGTPQRVAKPVLGGPKAAAKRGRTSGAGRSPAASRNSALKIDKSRKRSPLPSLDIDDVTE
jgi:hypothetical protein